MSGIGSFKNQLNKGIHTTGQLHTLHDNEKAVEKLGQLMNSQRKYFRGRGLSTSQIRKDIKEIKSADENLTFNDKKVVKGILKEMSAESYTKAGSEENKAAAHGQFIYKYKGNKNDEHALTSIANKTGATTSAFYKSNKTYGSIGAAVKDRRAQNIKSGDDKPKPAFSQTFKPVI